jgi:hypothetical protein
MWAGTLTPRGVGIDSGGHIADPSDIHRYIGRVPRTFHPTGHLANDQDYSCLSTLVLHDGPTAALVCGLDDEVLPDACGGETLRETLARSDDGDQRNHQADEGERHGDSGSAP